MNKAQSVIFEKRFSVSLLKIRGADARRKSKLTANTLLTRTTVVLGGNDTLSIFSSGMDAAGSIRGDVSRLRETRH